MISSAVYTVMFYGLSAAVILLAVLAVNLRQLLRAALALMGMLSLSAGLYVLLHAEFLAGVQVLVYIGGIVVLIVFAIMLTRSSELLEDHPRPLAQVLGALLSMFFLFVAALALRDTRFPVQVQTGPPVDDVRQIGLLLLDRGATGYLVPFELLSLLLLVAIIGGTVIARKVAPPKQPFTTGGDARGETITESARTQRDIVPGEGAP
ncbi:MAG: NADH-quinone oxidoreductase subunit J [Candidatus Hydrogenedentes bacterium]|nr:NADH-quinone oxidoreductase subunit J [Candidatus Hydrogenedentota bacterium]